MKIFKWVCAVGVIIGILTAVIINTANVPAQKKDVLTVVIDAGHGGIDQGVTGTNTGVGESEINLLIAKELEKRFKESGFKVVMTRTSSGGLYGVMSKGFKRRDMQKRKEIINSANADVMISIHQNFFSSSSRRGAQVFFKGNDEFSFSLASTLQRELNISGREYSPLLGDYYVLNEANCTAVLCECGFLSNGEDETLLLTEDYRKKIAALICEGTVKWFLERKEFVP